MSYSDTNDPAFESMGNAAHYTNIASTLFFAYAVVSFVKDDANDPLFDKSWKQDGFCVTHKEIPFWNSHDACLYFDMMAALLLGALYWKQRNALGMERVNEIFGPSILGILAHGIGHGAVAHRMREMGLPTLAEEDDLDKTTIDENINERIMEINMMDDILGVGEVSERGRNVFVMVCFWVGLMKAALPNLRMAPFAAMVLAAMAGQQFVDRQFAFTYVQTILLVAFSVNQLARKKEEKDFVYATHPMVVGVPVTFIGWIESTQCSAFVKDSFYGHLIYDGFIPVAMLVWYVVCYLQIKESRDNSFESIAKTADRKGKVKVS